MDRTLVSLLSIFFIAFVLFAAAAMFRDPLSNVLRAKDESVPSEEKSIILAWPLQLASDNQSSSTVSVFVISKTNRPLSNKNISLSTTQGTLNQNLNVTDKEGKATFSFRCDTPGTAQLSALIDNSIPIQQSVSIRCD